MSRGGYPEYPHLNESHTAWKLEYPLPDQRPVLSVLRLRQTESNKVILAGPTIEPDACTHFAVR